MYELKERSWSAFFKEPLTNQLFSGTRTQSPPDRMQRQTMGHVMRMPSREMGEYGILPETDPFIVVVCGVCKGAVKPQGLRKHIHRHNTGVAVDPAHLANLITPCSVSVSALKYDPKADNSNSSTSSVYNMTTVGVGGETTSCSSSGDASSSIVPGAFQDFSGLDNSSGAGASPPSAALTPGSAQSHKSSSSSSSLGKGSSAGKMTGSLKMKLSKSGLKGSLSSNSSPSSRSVSESPNNFLAGDTPKCSIRPSQSEGRGSSPLTVTTEAHGMVPSSSGGKKLSLKEREYDPNKHCGVILVDTGKHCTRTLTCKSHALSLRRQVTGRSLSFDQLLSDHRAMRALLASGKAPPPLPLASLAPPPPAQPSGYDGGGHHQASNKKREPADQAQHHRRKSPSPEPPPAKKILIERIAVGAGGSRKTHNSHHHVSAASVVTIKHEPVDEVPQPQSDEQPQPFRVQTADVPLSPRFEIKPMGHSFHENGLALHDGGQVVAASNGAFFLKSETAVGSPPELTKSSNAEGGSDANKLRELTPAAPSIITVPLTMLANVMYVNGRNCVLEPPVPLGEADSGDENRPGPQKGRHVEVVDGGERRSYLTLSSGRQQRATNRLRLNVIRTEDAAEQKNGAEESVAAQDYPGIDTWFHQIPKPTYVNCFKLCKLGSSAVLSKRYLNIRKSLILNMTASQGLGGSPGAVAALSRSNSQGGAGSSPVSVEKVNHFNAERIKV